MIAIPKHHKEPWLQRKIGACRFFAGFVRYWGPLACREVLEGWQSVLDADGELAGGDCPAKRRRRCNRESAARPHAAEGS